MEYGNTCCMTQGSTGGVGTYIDSDEACRILNYTHRSAISRFVASGELTPAMLAGRAFLFRRRDVEKLAAKLARKRGAA